MTIYHIVSRLLVLRIWRRRRRGAAHTKQMASIGIMVQHAIMFSSFHLTTKGSIRAQSWSVKLSHWPSIIWNIYLKWNGWANCHALCTASPLKFVFCILDLLSATSYSIFDEVPHKEKFKNLNSLIIFLEYHTSDEKIRTNITCFKTSTKLCFFSFKIFSFSSISLFLLPLSLSSSSLLIVYKKSEKEIVQ